MYVRKYLISMRVAMKEIADCMPLTTKVRSSMYNNVLNRALASSTLQAVDKVKFGEADVGHLQSRERAEPGFGVIHTPGGR